ncbi:MAG TPA: hypothetical protein VHE14_06745 [Solirubrobacteraceae bacterium]|nr:hypothetical protein [Solirubrobacteraceae bacterium]
MSAGATASGTRAVIAARHFGWLTPRRLRALTIALLSAALLASATLVSGSTPAPDRAMPHKPAKLTRSQR